VKTKQLITYRKKSGDDLRKILHEKRSELSDNYLKVSGSQEKNYSSKKAIRNDIAQILTIIREKEIIGEDSGSSLSKKKETNSSAKKVDVANKKSVRKKETKSLGERVRKSVGLGRKDKK